MTESAMSVSQVGFLLSLFAEPRAQVRKPLQTYQSQIATLRGLAAKNPRPDPQDTHFTKALCPEKWEFLAHLRDPQDDGVWSLCRKKGGLAASTSGILWDNYCLTRAGIRQAETLGAKHKKTRGVGRQRYDLSASATSVLPRTGDWYVASNERPALLCAAIEQIVRWKRV